MQFKDKVVIVAGGAQGIGKCIADEFQKEGAHVCIIDIQNPTSISVKDEENYFQGDLSNKETIDDFCKCIV